MSHSLLPSLFVSTMRAWPAGVPVWHRANGKCGLVVAWQVTHNGTAFVVVNWGTSADCEDPITLTHSPVPEGGEGEGWKEGVGT